MSTHVSAYDIGTTGAKTCPFEDPDTLCEKNYQIFRQLYKANKKTL